MIDTSTAASKLQSNTSAKNMIEIDLRTPNHARDLDPVREHHDTYSELIIDAVRKNTVLSLTETRPASWGRQQKRSAAMMKPVEGDKKEKDKSQTDTEEHTFMPGSSSSVKRPTSEVT